MADRSPVVAVGAPAPDHLTDRDRSGIIAAVTRYGRSLVVLGVLTLGQLAWPGVSGAAAAAGQYKGTTSERGTLTFTVGAGGSSVLAFSTTDDYNGRCDFHGGLGGVPGLTVVVPRMAVTKAGTFKATVKVKEFPFSGTATVVVSGRIVGSHASGTVNWAGKACGSGSPTPTAPMYLETFSAARG